MSYSAVPSYISCFEVWGDIFFVPLYYIKHIFLRELIKLSKNYKTFENTAFLKSGTFFEGFTGYKNIRKQILLDDKR